MKQIDERAVVVQVRAAVARTILDWDDEKILLVAQDIIDTMYAFPNHDVMGGLANYLLYLQVKKLQPWWYDANA